MIVFNQFIDAQTKRIQQQQQQHTLQSLNNSSQCLNQELNPSQQATVTMLVQSQQPSNYIVNQQSRFASVQQPSMTNAPLTIVNTKADVPKQIPRLYKPDQRIFSFL